ncbi:MAG: ATP-binding protein [Caulobacterales bacterium]|nr:ATP-binding protein [Caulobacterales bacterium]
MTPLRSRLRLRSQLSIAMIASALVSLAIVIVGLASARYAVETSWYFGQPEAVRSAYEAVFEQAADDADPLVDFVREYVEWEQAYAWRELLILGGVAALAALVAAVIGVMVARRIARPIEEVAEGARAIAQGRLGAHATETRRASLEAHELVSAFNDMSHALLRADRELTASAAAVAHELRTPLTILRGRLQGLSDGVFEPTPDALKALIAQVETLSHVADDLNALSLMMAGRLTPKVARVDLAEEARAVLAALTPDLESEGFAVEAALRPSIATADPARIRQALNALIDNARRYAASGRFLRVEAGEDDQWAVLRVIDRGPGIAPADRERVFDRWWRAEPSRSREDGGSGLGLAVVRAIATVHGGEARAASHEDGGAAFTLKLPRCDVLS